MCPTDCCGHQRRLIYCHGHCCSMYLLIASTLWLMSRRISTARWMNVTGRSLAGQKHSVYRCLKSALATPLCLILQQQQFASVPWQKRHFVPQLHPPHKPSFLHQQQHKPARYSNTRSQPCSCVGLDADLLHQATATDIFCSCRLQIPQNCRIVMPVCCDIVSVVVLCPTTPISAAKAVFWFDTCMRFIVHMKCCPDQWSGD